MKRAQLLAALDSVRAWARDLPDDFEPFRLQPIPGLVVQVREGKSANADKCRRYRERKATPVATPPPTPIDTGRDTTPTRVATPCRPVSQPVSDTVLPPLGSPLASPSGSPSDLPKEIAVVSEGSARSSARATAAARPRNHTEALTEPAAYVADLCRPGGTYDVTYAGLIQVHRMPWVLKPIQAWHEAGGDARELRLEAADGEVRAMVELTARGYLTSDLVRVARHLRGAEGKYRDKVLASCMTKAVVDIAMAELNEKPQRSSFANDMVRRVDAGSTRGPSALGDLLPKAAGGET